MSNDASKEVVFSIINTRIGGMDWNGPKEKMSSLEHIISKADSKQAFAMPVAIFVKWEDLWRKMRYLSWPPNVPEMCVCRCHWLQKMTHHSMINIAWLRANIKYSHSWHDNINMTKKGQNKWDYTCLCSNIKLSNVQHTKIDISYSVIVWNLLMVELCLWPVSIS